MHDTQSILTLEISKAAVTSYTRHAMCSDFIEVQVLRCLQLVNLATAPFPVFALWSRSRRRVNGVHPNVSFPQGLPSIVIGSIVYADQS